MKEENRGRRCLVILLACVMMVLPLAACASTGKTLMSLGKQTLSVNEYELFLSRQKGTLANYNYDVNSSAFFQTIFSADGATYNDYFCHEILEKAKTTLIKLYLFEEVYRLTLPEDDYTKIDEYLDSIVQEQFDGSETAFNRVLSQYSVNKKMLRDNYIRENKLDYLVKYVASITGDSAKEEYYEANYVRFRQILFPMYEYVYQTDENGDTVYSKDGGKTIAYDTKNGTPITGTDGKYRVDENGDVIYYTAEGKIAYDTEGGEPVGVDEDKDGYIDYVKLDEESLKILKDRATRLEELLEDGDYTTFEQYGNEFSSDDAWETYEGGIFLNKNVTYSVSYLNDLTLKLAEMQDGEVLLYQSENAYHLVMKYPLEKEAFKDKTNSDWFESFDSEVGNYILDAKCAEYMDRIQLDQEVLKGAKNMITVGINTDY